MNFYMAVGTRIQWRKGGDIPDQTKQSFDKRTFEYSTDDFTAIDNGVHFARCFSVAALGLRG